MRRHFGIFLVASLIASSVAVVRAQTPTGAESLALLDAALEQPAVDVSIGTRGQKTDVGARDLIKAASVAAVRALDAIGSSPCYAKWWAVSRMAYELMGDGVDLLDEADQYEAALDNDGRDQANAEFDMAFGAGFALWTYAPTLRDRNTCSPAASPSPTPAHTVTPERTATPEPSL